MAVSSHACDEENTAPLFCHACSQPLESDRLCPCGAGDPVEVHRTTKHGRHPAAAQRDWMQTALDMGAGINARVRRRTRLPGLWTRLRSWLRRGRH